MNERAFWTYLKDKMKGHDILLQRIESLTTARGIPDVSYTVDGRHGWIELKYMYQWPSRETTPVQVRNFTPLQRQWLFSRGEMGHGGTFLFLRVARNDFLLFDHQQAQMIGKLTEQELRDVAVKTWTMTNFDGEELCQILKKPLHPASNTDQTNLKSDCS